MCLAVPVMIMECEGTDALIEVGGVRRRVNVSLITEPQVGDYVLLHAGFAIKKWSEEDVERWREIVDEMAALEQTSGEGNE